MCLFCFSKGLRGVYRRLSLERTELEVDVEVSLGALAAAAAWTRPTTTGQRFSSAQAVYPVKPPREL